MNGRESYNGGVTHTQSQRTRQRKEKIHTSATKCRLNLHILVFLTKQKKKKPLYAMSDKLGKGILFLHSWNSELVKVKFWNSA